MSSLKMLSSFDLGLLCLSLQFPHAMKLVKPPLERIDEVASVAGQALDQRPAHASDHLQMLRLKLFGRLATAIAFHTAQYLLVRSNVRLDPGGCSASAFVAFVETFCTQKALDTMSSHFEDL